MDKITNEIIQTALKKMFEDKRFSICTIDKCIKIANIIPDKYIYERFSALHCIEFQDMSEDLRKWLFMEIENTFFPKTPEYINKLKQIASN